MICSFSSPLSACNWLNCVYILFYWSRRAWLVEGAEGRSCVPSVRSHSIPTWCLLVYTVKECYVPPVCPRRQCTHLSINTWEVVTVRRNTLTHLFTWRVYVNPLVISISTSWEVSGPTVWHALRALETSQRPYKQKCIYKQKCFLRFATAEPFLLGKPVPFSSDPESYLRRRGTERKLMKVKNPGVVCRWSAES